MCGHSPCVLGAGIRYCQLRELPGHLLRLPVVLAAVASGGVGLLLSVRAVKVEGMCGHSPCTLGAAVDVPGIIATTHRVSGPSKAPCVVQRCCPQPSSLGCCCCWPCSLQRQRKHRFCADSGLPDVVADEVPLRTGENDRPVPALDNCAGLPPDPCWQEDCRCRGCTTCRGMEAVTWNQLSEWALPCGVILPIRPTWRPCCQRVHAGRRSVVCTKYVVGNQDLEQASDIHNMQELGAVC